MLAWQVGYASILPKDYLDGLDVASRVAAWTERFTQASDQAAADAGRCRHLVGELDGRVVGGVTIGVYRPAEGQSEQDARAENLCELWALNLRPEAWGSGVAQRLMAAALDGLRAEQREPTAALWVLEGNARGRRFYEKEGWAADGTVKVETLGSMEVRELRYIFEL